MPPTTVEAAQRAARSLGRETSFTLKRPLRFLAGFAATGIVLRVAYLLHVKAEIEGVRDAAEARARELEKTPVPPPAPVKYERVWARVYALEERIAREEGAPAPAPA